MAVIAAGTGAGLRTGSTNGEAHHGVASTAHIFTVLSTCVAGIEAIIQ